MEAENNYSEPERDAIAAAFLLITSNLLSIGGSDAKSANNLFWSSMNLKAKALDDPYNGQVTAQALVTREFELGMKTKCEIGLENDTFQKSSGFNNNLDGAFQAGQMAAKPNWLCKQRFLDRLFKREPVFERSEFQPTLDSARAAHNAFIDRFD